MAYFSRWPTTTAYYIHIHTKISDWTKKWGERISLSVTLWVTNDMNRHCVAFDNATTRHSLWLLPRDRMSTTVEFKLKKPFQNDSREQRKERKVNEWKVCHIHSCLKWFRSSLFTQRQLVKQRNEKSRKNKMVWRLIHWMGHTTQGDSESHTSKRLSSNFSPAIVCLLLTIHTSIH